MLRLSDSIVDEGRRKNRNPNHPQTPFILAYVNTTPHNTTMSELAPCGGSRRCPVPGRRPPRNAQYLNISLSLAEFCLQRTSSLLDFFVHFQSQIVTNSASASPGVAVLHRLCVSTNFQARVNIFIRMAHLCASYRRTESIASTMTSA